MFFLFLFALATSNLQDGGNSTNPDDKHMSGTTKLILIISGAVIALVIIIIIILCCCKKKKISEKVNQQPLISPIVAKDNQSIPQAIIPDHKFDGELDSFKVDTPKKDIKVEAPKEEVEEPEPADAPVQERSLPEIVPDHEDSTEVHDGEVENLPEDEEGADATGAGKAGRPKKDYHVEAVHMHLDPLKERQKRKDYNINIEGTLLL